jgi:UDP-N-acetylglucosamine--N-acetylmuramyl-(pentapeptide) pyrophosphoryl-undecaprenol N-acetylglucosamine transferase
MDYAYAVADVVISEQEQVPFLNYVWLKNRCILIPSPNVAEDHQTKNAMALVTYNAALLIKDIEAKEKLKEAVLNLMQDETQCIKLSENIGRLAFKDSATVIANEILSLINTKKK